MSLSFSLEKTLRTTKVHIAKLHKMGISTVRDLLEFYPRALESTEIRRTFGEIILMEKNTLQGVLTHIRKEKTARGKQLTKARLTLEDATTLEVVWFTVPYQLRTLQEGTSVYLVGRVKRDYGKLQVVNPEIHLDANLHIDTLRCIYPESPPITSKWMREKVAGLLVFAKEFPEIIPKEAQETENLMPKIQAVRAIHQPESWDQWQQARARLAWEEIFGIQTRVIRAKRLRQRDEENHFLIPFDPEAAKEDFKRLPFGLTNAQKRVLADTLKDLEKPQPMHRLVQGDVGSGKTVVAFLAAMAAVRAGHQVAILAPTEILAKQHFATALKFFGNDAHVQLLTGSVPATQKAKLKTQLQNGDIDVLIGTHAILTEDTVFQSLALAVVDEQHRFGVEQRSILAQNHAHMLAMTATPIPRTLALTVYGDQDLSVIDEMPPGRQPIVTRVVADPKTRKLCTMFIDDQIKKNRQVFWVCPLVDESDHIEAKNVKDEADYITNELYPQHRVQFLHGKMKPKEKDAIMQAFRDGEYDVLVSTSVIEVGVDIPNATVMVIENSERFGLSQLHQFRGRIGRNDMQSYCFLMTGKVEDKDRERLRATERTQDGMKLAEIDLKIRGAGEVYGLKQSGLPDLKCADLNDLETMKSARDWATKLLDEDLELTQYPELRKFLDEQEVYF